MISGTVKCEACSGDGRIDDRCGRCNGSGEGMWDGSRCSECRGRGDISMVCETCDGEGTVAEPEDEE